ncbi:MAG: tyrosine-type recombinase/integrase [Thermoguttaceae bacterium]|jgi:integrase
MRRPEPYFKKSHHAWYVNLNGRPKRLATEDQGEKAAWDHYDKIMAGRQPVKHDGPVVDLLDRFLDHHKSKSADATFQFYVNALDSFAHYIGPKLRISDLKPFHVYDWIDRNHKSVKRATSKGTVDTGKPTSDNYRRNLIRAVKAAFRWAEHREHIDRSPIRHVELPTARAREVYLTPEQWEKLVAEVSKSRDGGSLLDLITAMKETGCRPQEARRVEARHFDQDGRCWIFPIDESKGKKDKRVVLLTDKVFEICQRLALKYPDGPLFRTSAGKPWARRGFSFRLYCLSKKLEFKVCPYAIRHTFATDAIVRGVDLQTIATLMGHVDLNMLSRIYQHIKRRSDHLRAGLKKATGEVA